MKNVRILCFISLFVSSVIKVEGSPEIIRIRQNTDSVGLYDKLELQLELKAEFTNPFDPDDIDITTTFISPSGKQWQIPGFYNYAHWSAIWMVRFSPDETGEWKYTIFVQDRNGRDTSEVRSFVAIPSPYHGPIQIASNQRYLKHSDGNPFYGVGFWYNDSYAEFNRGHIEAEELDHLKSLGINIISTYITPLETIGSGLGRYDQNICGRLDEVLVMCEDRNMQLSLNLWFHAYLSETVWGGGNIRWHTNPYRQITYAKDFFRSKLALEYQEKLYRYFIARWGYSRSLALWFVVDEVNGTDGWVTGDSLAAADWGRQVHEYFKTHDPYNHPTTGTRSGGINQFWHEGYQIFDMAAREIYEAQGFSINKAGTLDSANVHPLTQSYSNYAQEIRKLWDGYEKPAIIGETGWDHSFYEPDMPGYLAQYHNALWVCLATGSAMTPFWWAHSGRVNDNVVTRQITHIREFTEQIPFSTLTNLSPVDVNISKGDGFAMKSDQLTFGWVVNPNTDVAGDTVSVYGMPNGKYHVKLYHTWRGQFFHEADVNSVVESAMEGKATSMDGSVSFVIPILHTEGSHANYVGQDVAFILELVE